MGTASAMSGARERLRRGRTRREDASRRSGITNPAKVGHRYDLEASLTTSLRRGGHERCRNRQRRAAHGALQRGSLEPRTPSPLWDSNPAASLPCVRGRGTEGLEGTVEPFPEVQGAPIPLRSPALLTTTHHRGANRDALEAFVLAEHLEEARNVAGARDEQPRARQAVVTSRSVASSFAPTFAAGVPPHVLSSRGPTVT